MCPSWGGHSQRLGAGQPGRCDRGDQMRTEDRDAGARGEAGQHIAGVVHAGGHPGQPDQAGQQGSGAVGVKSGAGGGGGGARGHPPRLAAGAGDRKTDDSDMGDTPIRQGG